MQLYQGNVWEESKIPLQQITHISCIFHGIDIYNIYFSFATEWQILVLKFSISLCYLWFINAHMHTLVSWQNMAMVRVLSEVYNGHGLCSVTDLYSGHSQSALSVTCTMAMTRVLSDVYNGHDQSAQWLTCTMAIVRVLSDWLVQWP